MYKKHRRLQYSPSDLVQYMESPFASWMDRYLIEYPEKAPKKDPTNALIKLFQKKGQSHETVVKSLFSRPGLTVITISGDSLAEKFDRTLDAMNAGSDVIVQARLEKEPFSGYADFLVKVPGNSNLGDYHYEVWEAKLAHKIKPTAVIQVCCYTEMLEALQNVRADCISLALGSGSCERVRTDDYFYYYHNLKSAFLQAQEQFDGEKCPDPAASKSWGHWSNYAEQLFIEQDHLFQVARIRREQIQKLNRAGIATMEALAYSNRSSVDGLNTTLFQRLKSQAALQKSSLNSATPHYKIISPSAGQRIGLARLPPHSPLDVFFDIEGYPFEASGLEYLWGCTYFNDQGGRVFKDFWAHNRHQEKLAFAQFIDWAYQRWLQDPSMHIYHYANYEVAACRRLMGLYGICEKEMDQLWCNEVFVDLYKLVNGSLLFGEPKYSIKNVEHLYRGKRETAVGKGSDSILVYEQWRELQALGEQGDSWHTSSLLKDIRDYNIDDCNSLQELAVWLRQQQSAHSIQYLPTTTDIEPNDNDEHINRIQLRDRLLERASREAADNPATAALTEQLACTLEFHLREARPVFWRLFERLELSPIDLIEDLNCLIGCERTQRKPFQRQPTSYYLAYEYQCDPLQGFKGVQGSFYLLGVTTDEGKQEKATYIKDESDLESGLILVEASREPPSIISLIPDEYINPGPMQKAIDQIVADYEAGHLSNQPSTVGATSNPSAIIDILTGSKPRIKGHHGGPIAPSSDPKKRLQQIIRAVTQLDNSYLIIQGPPGTGKSSTAKKIIAALLQAGAKIGITSNSHRAINHLLLSTAKYCKKQGIAATFSCTKEDDPELTEFEVSILKNNKIANHICPNCVIGTTAWGFARDDMTETLDYLCVDEAGQVPMANLIAMSRAANNLILIGDQMQLKQPSQAAHPAKSGLSILDYLLGKTPIIPDDMGVFLNTSYRLHSSINRYISRLFYEGKLTAHPDNDKRTIKVPNDYQGPLDKEAGIVFIPVVHEGNTQASNEEIARIVQLANSLLGREFVIGDSRGLTRPIDWNDMLFVAPYNHQVSKLKMALGKRAKVGSVDKFQGQEAPIVFLSMCVSDASESPRGLSFLLDKRRINVALSRAQTLAIIVGNPNIGNTAVNSLDQLKLVNLFNAITS